MTQHHFAHLLQFLPPLALLILVLRLSTVPQYCSPPPPHLFFILSCVIGFSFMPAPLPVSVGLCSLPLHLSFSPYISFLFHWTSEFIPPLLATCPLPSIYPFPSTLPFLIPLISLTVAHRWVCRCWMSSFFFF